MKKAIVISLMMLWMGQVFPQSNYNAPGKFFQPMSVNGNVNFEGGYRYQVGTTNDIYNYRKSPVLNGGILLNTRSCFWHPCLISLELGGEYRPGLERSDYLVAPDLSESRTYAGLNAAINFFSGKPINFGAYYRYSDGLANREDLANIRTKNQNYGANLNWSNKVAPIQLNYDRGSWDENEIGTRRDHYTFHERYQGRITKSFSERDRNEFVYFHNDNRREDLHISESRSISDNFNLDDLVFFDPEHKYKFHSMITFMDKRGIDTFKRLQVSEGLSFQLPANLKLMTNYKYSNIARPDQGYNVHNVDAALMHQLFASLTSSIQYEYSKADQSYYREDRNRIGVNLQYQKNIPKGTLMLGYSYNLENLRHHSDSYELRVLDEAHTLTDGQIELLDKPDAIITSVIVTDITGTIIFRPNLDYILVERNAYLEIQRVPGGQIPNTASVWVDYTVLQQGDYQYDRSNMAFNARLSIFNRLVEIYYRGNWQDYFNLENAENVTLNYVKENLYGLKLERKFASLGVEYKDHNSTITPYTLWTYFIQLQGNIKSRILFSLNGNVNYYSMQDVGKTSHQTYGDLTGSLGWNMTEHARFNAELGYRKQIGNGIDLDLIRFKSEFMVNYRKLYVTAGLELYRRIWLGEQLNYYNVYVKLIRTFDWAKR